MDRKEEILKCFTDITKEKESFLIPLIDNFVFIESQLSKLRNLPHIRIHPNNPERQEVTPAGKMYKEYMQSYLNALKVLQKELLLEKIDSESPLLKMLKEFEENE